MAELVSQREYARRRGVSQPAVVKAIKTGRIKTVDGKIDPLEADKAWPRNTQSKVSGGATVVPPGLQAANGQGRAGPNGAGPGVDYASQRAIHEGYRARLAKVAYEVQTGKLVDVDTVRVKVFNNGRRARDMLLSIPDQLSAILAGETNQFEVHRILNEAIRRVCDDIANAKPY